MHKNLTIISKGVGLCPTVVAEKIDLHGEIAWMAGTIWMLAKCVADVLAQRFE
jgi:hypothetical protein